MSTKTKNSKAIENEKAVNAYFAKRCGCKARVDVKPAVVWIKEGFNVRGSKTHLINGGRFLCRCQVTDNITPKVKSKVKKVIKLQDDIYDEVKANGNSKGKKLTNKQVMLQVMELISSMVDD